MSKNFRIAIQGDIGSNHYILCRLLFPEIKDSEILCASTFAQVCEAVEAKHSDWGLMAIENSIAGSIVSVYDLLSLHKLHVIKEAYLPIHHSLIGQPQAKMSDISVVYSHEMALRQCEEFLAFHHIESREFFDTAAAVPFVRKLDDVHVAAIAPAMNANLHKMKVLANNIETHKQNFTRFLLVASKAEKQQDDLHAQETQKALCECTLAHTPGKLAELLMLLANAGCNLTKIESRPISERPWEYRFFIDVLSSPLHSTAQFLEVLRNAQAHTMTWRIHGIIKEGKVHTL